ncbi:MAG: iron chelate uptake ABC transporter family permease subunit [Oscillospiraceae bacterium]|jgi:iron complex transport system permease protein|nr:iron chelate uptake ABC transporter family permease subunit [Oscillospiraceae bacterium]
MIPEASAKTIKLIESGRRARHRRWLAVTLSLSVFVAVLGVAMLLLGNTIYPPGVVWRALRGESIPGASFAVVTLRLPRMLSGLLAGFAFGMSGGIFQTMLRNPLASPNIIGITSGSSAAAVFCILVLKISGATASFAAVAAGLAATALIYAFSRVGGFSGGKLILIGIGVQAMLNALISFMLLKAANYDVPAAMRWLTGSLNTIQMKDLPPLAISMLLCCPPALLYSRQLGILELGEASATTLGVPTDRTRVTLIIGSVFLLAFATATTGPIAFVAFLSGPIAKRLAGAGLPTELPAGLVGAALVLCSDLLGQFAFGVKYPVGVITGILGAPYLIYLLIRKNKAGGSQ